MPDDIDRLMEEARETILDHGHITHYSDNRSRPYQDLPRAWTTGRTMWMRPELMIVGPFTEGQMQVFMNEAVDVDSLRPLEVGTVVELGGRKFVAQEAEPALFFIALKVFGTISGFQLVWADPNTDEFPGQPQPFFPPGSEVVFGE